MNAIEILNAAAQHIDDRAASRDLPQGERSMSRAVVAFNALTKLDLTEPDGWLFMAVLKAARATGGAYNPDDYEDGAAYFALAGESAAKESMLGTTHTAHTTATWTVTVDEDAIDALKVDKKYSATPPFAKTTEGV